MNVVINLILLSVVFGLARTVHVVMSRAFDAEGKLEETRDIVSALRGDVVVLARELTRMELEHDKLEHQVVQRSPCGGSVCCYCDEAAADNLLRERLLRERSI